jgi:hypothetical protein
VFQKVYLKYLVEQNENYYILVRRLGKQLKGVFVNELIKSLSKKNKSKIKRTQMYYFDKLMKTNDEIIFKRFYEFKKKYDRKVEKENIKEEFPDIALLTSYIKSFNKVSKHAILLYTELISLYLAIIIYINKQEIESKIKNTSNSTQITKLKKMLNGLDERKLRLNQTDMKKILNLQQPELKELKNELIETAVNLTDKYSKYLEIYRFTHLITRSSYFKDNKDDIEKNDMNFDSIDKTFGRIDYSLILDELKSDRNRLWLMHLITTTIYRMHSQLIQPLKINLILK